ncbi:tetratricopeptide repeat protein [Gemmatimonas sp.]|uniref:tetratricopeptide repeat protein n=1 Tax=Gemmatimonas sp. TaxID=1962908 RepID=UPI00398391C0
MNPRLMMWPVAIGITIAGVGGVAYQSAMRVDLDVPSPSTATSSVGASRADSREAARAARDVQIVVWGQALAADPISALAMGQLAALHMQKARESGSFSEYLEAEALARRSLATRTRRNAATAVTLTNTLLAQHRFTEAMSVARKLVEWEPEQPAYRALLGEVAMELGDDSTASAMFNTVWTARSGLSIAPRLARWLELTNHVEKSRRVLHAARDEALARRDLSTETKTWFHLRVGDLELRAGRARDAAQAYRAGLALDDQDPRLLAAMARLAEQQEKPDAVIAWGELAIAVRMDPATLGLLSNAYAQRGDSAKAGEYAQTLAIVAAAQRGPYDRAWSLHLLDQQQEVSAVLTRALVELETRRDVYGYDLAAWALYRAGRYGEARAMMAQALRFETPDPLLRTHAALIATAPAVVSASR